MPRSVEVAGVIREILVAQAAQRARRVVDGDRERCQAIAAFHQASQVAGNDLRIFNSFDPVVFMRFIHGEIGKIMAEMTQKTMIVIANKNAYAGQ